MTVQTKDNNLFYFALLITFIFFTVKLTAQNSIVLNHDAEFKANQLLQKGISDKNFIGVAAGISINQKHVWLSAEGHSNKAEQQAMQIITINRTASIAKSMTAIAVMQLVEQGLIDLDVPIQTYIPDFPKKKEGEITTRHLLYQTSGIPNYASVKEVQTQKNYTNLAAAVDVFKHRDLQHAPGTAFAYATYNYVILGLIIEKVSGLSYEEYMKENIWKKAGMINTGVEKYQSTYANKSSLYHRKKKGKIKLTTENNLSNRIPGGGFYSCVEDLLRFGEAVLNNELISAETLAQMLTKSNVEKPGNPYGMGWFLYGGKENPQSAFGHSGEQSGVSAQLIIIPGRKTVIAVLANTSGAWHEAFALCAELCNLSKEVNETGE